MIDDSGLRGTEAPDEARYVLSRVREIDPSGDVDAVRWYLQEIAEADAVLRAIDLNGEAAVAGFSPFWPGEGERR